MMSGNLRAFLYLIRWAEGTSGPDGYRTIVGGNKFDSFDDHPNVVASGVFSNGKAWRSTAAGGYQFLHSTWLECKQALNLPDFSPESQDQAAVYLIKRRGALHAVEEGDLDNAIKLCASEWASLPGSPYGQPTKSLDACRVIFERAGGIAMRASIPSSDGGRAAEPTLAPSMQAPAGPSTVEPSPRPAGEVSAPLPETRMPLPVAAVIALGAELLKLLPFAAKPKNAEAIDKVAPKLIEFAKEAAGPAVVNEQAAVEAVQKNPTVQQAFISKAALQWADVEPFLRYESEERAKAREFLDTMTAEGPTWRQVGAGLVVSIISLFIIIGGGLLFWDMMYNPNLDPGQKGLILGAMIAAFTTAVGFWLGGSRGSQLKDQTIAEQAKR